MASSAEASMGLSDRSGRVATARVDAHVIPQAWAHVIPQDRAPPVLPDVLLPGGDFASGSFVGPVAGAVHEDLVAGVDEPVEQGLGYLTTTLRVSETSITARRVCAGGCGGRLIFLCP
jgi:hypothetical protein